jgi:hypothetical protein
MQLIAPDLYTEVGQLSGGACALGLVVAVLLWLTGWWQHRFWLVASLTTAAGVVGLQQGRSAGVQPLVCGLLAALAAGLIAMELSKVLAYAGGGLAASLVIRAYLPTVEPLVAFLAGGLLGVVMFRLWMLTLTSFLGTLLGTFFGLAMATRMHFVDGAAVVLAKGTLLNCVVGGGTLAGILVQARFDSWRAGSKTRKKAKLMATLNEAERTAVSKASASKGAASFWGKFRPRKAG